METIVSVATYAVAHYQEVITATVGILTGVIGICLLIPGDQPEAALQKIVGVISKFSKK